MRPTASSASRCRFVPPLASGLCRVGWLPASLLLTPHSRPQECVRDPKDNSGKNAHCVPCGWCTVEQHNWNAEVAGSCVALSDPSGKDGFCADPLASGFCASTICDQDDDDCICDANSCPVVSLLIHLISLQGFWLLAALLLLALVGVASACSLICNRPPPREIVLVRESDTVRGADRLLGTHSSTASEEYERL